ncbi:hypothetical protein V8C42DRAFT_168703 [Trichoderma barbatum]
MDSVLDGKTQSPGQNSKQGPRFGAEVGPSFGGTQTWPAAANGDGHDASEPRHRHECACQCAWLQQRGCSTGPGNCLLAGLLPDGRAWISGEGSSGSPQCSGLSRYPWPGRAWARLRLRLRVRAGSRCACQPKAWAEEALARQPNGKQDDWIGGAILQLERLAGTREWARGDGEGESRWRNHMLWLEQRQHSTAQHSHQTYVLQWSEFSHCKRQLGSGFSAWSGPSGALDGGLFVPILGTRVHACAGQPRASTRPVEVKYSGSRPRIAWQLYSHLIRVEMVPAGYLSNSAVAASQYRPQPEQYLDSHSGTSQAWPWIANRIAIALKEPVGRGSHTFPRDRHRPRQSLSGMCFVIW